MPGGMSSTWCVTSTSGGAVGSVVRSASAATSCSRPARSSRADGSSSSTRAGSVISVRASRTRWRSPDDSELSGRGREPLDPHALEAGQCPLVVRRRVPMPPRLEGGVAGRAHHVEHGQLLAQLVGEGGRGVADAPPQPRTSTRPSRSPSTSTVPERRVVVQRGHAQQRRLAAAVGSEQQPPLACLDGQRDVGDQDASSPGAR